MKVEDLASRPGKFQAADKPGPGKLIIPATLLLIWFLLGGVAFSLLEEDLQLLLESDIGVVIVETDKIEAARQIMAELRGETT